MADGNLRLYLAALRSAAEQVRRVRPEAAFALAAGLGLDHTRGDIEWRPSDVVSAWRHDNA